MPCFRMPISLAPYAMIPFLFNVSAGQIAPSPYGSGNQRQQVPSQMLGPGTMTECQGVNNCATWTFQTKAGLGEWPTGEVANLQIESFGNNQIVISRTDVKGPKTGLTATYSGTLEQGEVAGKFTSLYKGKTETGHWYGMPSEAANIQQTTLGARACYDL